MTDLINRLESADGADRELDFLVWEALGRCAHRNKTVNYVQGDSDWDCDDCGVDVTGLNNRVPHVTGSIDTALALVGEVLPGWKWSVNRLDYGYTASVKPPLKTQGDLELQDLGEMAAHPTNPAIALLIALLKAHELLKAKD